MRVVMACLLGRARRVAPALAYALLCGGAHPAQAAYSVAIEMPDGTRMTDPGSPAYGAAISADGRWVVGACAAPTSSAWQACRWSEATGIELLGELVPGGSSAAYGVSADGSVVTGAAEVQLPPDWRTGVFRWTAATGMQEIRPFAGEPVDALPRGVSDDGSVIVGWASTKTGPSTSTIGAFRWTESGTGWSLGAAAIDGLAIDASADGSVVAGRGGPGDPLGGGAGRWTELDGFRPLGPVPPYLFDVAAISGDGRVIVGGNVNYFTDGYRWSAEQGTTLLPAPSEISGWLTAVDVSYDGSVIVGAFRGDPLDHAFVWTATRGTRRLRDVMLEDHGLAPPPDGFERATAVSADGQRVVAFACLEGSCGVPILIDLRPACGDEHDNDGDGATDAADVECTLTRGRSESLDLGCGLGPEGGLALVAIRLLRRRLVR